MTNIKSVNDVMLAMLGVLLVISILRFVIVWLRDKSARAGYNEVKSSLPFLIIMFVLNGVLSPRFTSFLKGFGNSGVVISLGISIIAVIIAVIVLIKILNPSKEKYKEAKANGESFFKSIWLSFKKN
ncbi:MAG: hypothetical protein ACRCWG_04955 [Sarcina sp.]